MAGARALPESCSISIKMDGIARQDWLDYIGPAAPAYLAAYSRMQLQKSKVSMSFSALLFGPFYFFYRKAWKPA